MNTYQLQRKQLEERTINFSIDIINMCGKYSKSLTLRPLVSQLIRSATSIGANYAEANNASSKADFKNKIFIAKKEAAETRYWLRIFDSLVPEGNFSRLQQEALELNLILQKIISTLKTSNGMKNGK